MTPVAVAAVLGMQLLFSPPSGGRAEPVGANPDTLRVPDAIDAKARELVRQLGDRDYDDREGAQKELRELGRLALPALVDGYEKSPVPEVTERCDQLLPRARALDIRARVDCFAADANGKYEHHLPGAKEFFAITGRTDKARALYRDMLLSSNRGLISGIGGSETELAQQAVNRRIELYPRAVVVGGSINRPTPPSALDIAALLFVESTIPEKLLTEAGTTGGVAVSSPSVLLSQPAFRTALTADDQKEAMTAITVKWCETREELRTIYSCMTVAGSLKLPVAIPLAKKVLSTKGATPLYKVQAVCNVAKVGKPEDAALIAPLLTDDTQAAVGVVAIVNGVQQRSPVQVRDVALAMTLLMNQQDPIAFGMKSRYAANAANETLKYNYMNYYFDDTDSKAEESRKAAFKKWDEVKAKK
jgi:hypothetical protein